MIKQKVTEKTVRQFINAVSDQQYAMSGPVIAAMAGQAAALAEACMQISLENQVDKLDWQNATAQIAEMLHFKNTLIEWCDQDATALADYLALKDTDQAFQQQKLLCESSAEICRISLEALTLLADFRPMVYRPLQEDFELTLDLLKTTARTALLLFQSNLRLWADTMLFKEYQPLLTELKNQYALTVD